ncbi:MAG: methyltransferase [Candidatus Rhabdochlamydia sp.]
MQSLKSAWQEYEVAKEGTHHLRDEQPAYPSRFLSVLKFHAPGFAPAEDETGAFHIDLEGRPLYSQRFLKTFGFYALRAAVQDASGWYHIDETGEALYSERFRWCGNYQENLCVVQDHQGSFFHLTLEGRRAYSARFAYAGDFHDQVATIQDERGLYTHVNDQAEMIHGKWFLDLDVYHKGFARAKDQGGWFHINMKGEAITSERFLQAEPFYNGIARCETHDQGVIRLSETGEVIQILRQPRLDPFHQVSAELTSYWRFYTLQAAHTFNLFDQLPQNSFSLHHTLFIPLHAVQKLMRALQEMHFVRLGEDQLWHCTAQGALLRQDHPDTLKSAATLWAQEHLACWQQIDQSLKTGESLFLSTFEMTWFEWLKHHPEKNALYHEALWIYAKKDYEKLGQAVDFSSHHTVLDLGGGSGALLQSLLYAHPHLQGILFDLPHVVDLAVIPASLRSQMRLIAGSFFDECRIPQADCCILSRVLHDWDDDKAVVILQKVIAALTEERQSRIYILEKIQDEQGCEGALLDLHMFLMTGGKERSLADFKRLFHQVGLTLESVTPFNSVIALMTLKRSDA